MATSITTHEVFRHGASLGISTNLGFALHGIDYNYICFVAAAPFIGEQYHCSIHDLRIPEK